MYQCYSRQSESQGPWTSCQFGIVRPALDTNISLVDPGRGGWWWWWWGGGGGGQKVPEIRPPQPRSVPQSDSRSDLGFPLHN